LHQNGIDHTLCSQSKQMVHIASRLFDRVWPGDKDAAGGTQRVCEAIPSLDQPAVMALSSEGEEAPTGLNLHLWEAGTAWVGPGQRILSGGSQESVKHQHPPFEVHSPAHLGSG
jgi:hypothetical protein